VHAATQPTTVPNIAHGVVGSMYSAVQLDDTYLVPTADDVRPSLAIVKVEAPATAPATNPSTAATLPASPPPASEPATSAPASTTSASSAPSNQ